MMFATVPFRVSCRIIPDVRFHFLGSGRARCWRTALLFLLFATHSPAQEADHLATARKLHSQGKFQQAIPYYEKSIDQHPFTACLGLGECLQAVGKKDEATKRWRQATTGAPEKATEWLDRGNSYARLGQPWNALTDYNQAIRLDPNLSFAYMSRANLYSSLRQYRRAVADCDQIIRIQPTALNYSYRALTHYSNQDFAKAVADCNEAIRLDPKSPEAYYTRGLSRLSSTEYKQAIPDFDEAIRLDPELGQAYTCRAKCHFMLGNYRESIADYDRGLLLAPGLAEDYYFRGTALATQQKYERAVADFNEAIRRDPKDQGGYVGRGNALLELKKYPEAIADLDQAIRINPKDELCFAVRAAAYDRLAKLKVQQPASDEQTNDYRRRAVADLLEAVRLAPDNPQFHNNAAWLLATSTFDPCRDGAKAVEFAERACDLVEWKETGYLDTLAAAYAAKGDYSKAVEYQEKAIAELKSANADEPTLSASAARLLLYRDKKPFRE